MIRIEADEDAIRPFLEQRHSWGGDKLDEMWDGVLHLVRQPTPSEQQFKGELLIATSPLAEARGLEALYTLSIFRPGSEGEADYRTPDLIYFRPHEEGRIEGAELVVEVLWPGDESFQKIPWYRAVGVKEVLLLDLATRVPELYLLDGSEQKGTVRSSVLGCTFEVVEGPALRISWEGGEARV